MEILLILFYNLNLSSFLFLCKSDIFYAQLYRRDLSTHISQMSWSYRTLHFRCVNHKMQGYLLLHV